MASPVQIGIEPKFEAREAFFWFQSFRIRMEEWKFL